jgi:hypothetical protein
VLLAISRHSFHRHCQAIILSGDVKQLPPEIRVVDDARLATDALSLQAVVLRISHDGMVGPFPNLGDYPFDRDNSPNLRTRFSPAGVTTSVGQFECTGMYLIRLERGHSEADRVVMWLTSVLPQRWGERSSARRFPTKGDASRAVKSIKIVGEWSIEEATEVRL